MGTKHKKNEAPPYCPLREFGPFDLFRIETLELLYRQKGGMDEQEAKQAVGALIRQGRIKYTKYKNLEGKSLQQKNEI